SGGVSWNDLPDGASILIVIVFFGLPVGVTGWVAYRLQRRRRRRQQGVGRLARPRFAPLTELFAVLARARVVRQPWTTPAEFLASPQVGELVIGEEQQRMLDCYHASRFGGQRAQPVDLVELAAIIDR